MNRTDAFKLSDEELKEIGNLIKKYKKAGITAGMVCDSEVVDCTFGCRGSCSSCDGGCEAWCSDGCDGTRMA